jgi:hypothetical protein
LNAKEKATSTQGGSAAIPGTEPERWRDIPGLRVPEQWPPEYEDFAPVRLDGPPLSEEIIRGRAKT